MILPQTYYGALALLALTLFCWGSWANTFKLAGKWRYELYYFDFAFGALLAGVVCAFTFGSQPTADGLEFLDDIVHTGRRQIAYAFAAGIIFNLANMLLMGAVSVAGLAVAFPAALGTAFIVNVIASFLIQPKANAVLLFAGAAVIGAAVITDGVALKTYSATKVEEEVKPAKGKARKKKESGLKAIILSVVSGLLMGSFFPLIDMSKAGENGLGPY